MDHWIEIGDHNQEDPIIVNLLEDEEAINITKESEKTDWEYLFENSPKFMMPLNFQSELDESVSIASHLETEIVGRKIWQEDDSEIRPASITIYLLANDKKIASKIVTAEDNWTYRFSNVPDHDSEGKKILYTLKEKPVEGYDTSYHGFDVINYLIK